MLAITLLAAISCGICFSYKLQGSQPNPPNWPSSVIVFTPGNSSNQAVIDQIFAQQGGHSPAFNGQWSNARYALLFKPGTHNV